tara:strand:+ start:1244 stop:1726 length:483 start_codon:yes stop_codon:yes gene_type:complete
MGKTIPNPLKRAILNALMMSENDPLPSAAVSDRVNDDPDLPASMKKTPRQIAYVLKQMARDHPDVITTHVLSKNGVSRHGNERFRVGYTVVKGATLQESISNTTPTRTRERKQQITINLPPAMIEYLRSWKASFDASPATVIEQLIRADIEANGIPGSDV